MRFAWDPRKAETNRRKHGVGFEEAASVFFDPHCLELADEKHSTSSEIRVLRIGMSLYSRVLLVVFTERSVRGEEEVYRIISGRRANRKERNAYLGRA